MTGAELVSENIPRSIEVHRAIRLPGHLIDGNKFLIFILLRHPGPVTAPEHELGLGPSGSWRGLRTLSRNTVSASNNIGADQLWQLDLFLLRYYRVSRH